MAADLRGDDGAVGGVEALALGALIFVVGTLIVANAWAVIDAKIAAAAAAREAARAYVESPVTVDPARRARAAAEETLAAHGRDPARLLLDVDAEALFRCARVVAEARYPVPPLVVPWLGEAPAITVAARHSELVDPLRSGLPGAATCVR